MTVIERERQGRPSPGPLPSARPADGTRELAAAVLPGLLAGAAAIHLGMVPLHSGVSEAEGIAFAVAGWLQASCAALLWKPRTSRRALLAVASTNALIVIVWLVSRTVGLPVGTSSPGAEKVGLADGLATVLEVALILGCAKLLRDPARTIDGETRRARGLGPALPLVLFVGLASLALTQSAGHAHSGTGAPRTEGDDAVASGGHGHDHESTGAASDCDSLRDAMSHHWSTEGADQLTALGCNAEATAAAAGAGEPALDGAPFVDRLLADVTTSLGTTRLAVCAVPNLPPRLLGGAEGLVFHFARTWQACDDPSGVAGRVAVATFPTRLARDGAATSPTAGAPARWVYGRFVVAALDGTSPEVIDLVGAALASVDGAVAVPG